MVGLITLKIKTQMKKFAKYLHVEGEIEVPCIVLETLTNGKTELFQVDNFNDINLENIPFVQEIYRLVIDLIVLMVQVLPVTELKEKNFTQ